MADWLDQLKACFRAFDWLLTGTNSLFGPSVRRDTVWTTLKPVVRCKVLSTY